MRSRGISAFFGGCVLLLSSMRVEADVTAFGVSIADVYRQTGDAPPLSTPFLFQFYSQLVFNTRGDLNVCTATYPGPRSPLHYDVGVNEALYVANFSSLAERSTAFPTGSAFQFNISGGSLGSLSANLSTPTQPLFPIATPFLTGSSFSQLQGCNPGRAITVTFPAHDIVPGASDARTHFLVFRAADGSLAYWQALPSNSTFATVHPYSLEADTVR